MPIGIIAYFLLNAEIPDFRLTTALHRDTTFGSAVVTVLRRRYNRHGSYRMMVARKLISFSVAKVIGMGNIS